MENPELQYGQMNFNLPHDVVQLPSKGIFYKNKKKSVKVGYLTAADENILLASENNDLIMNLLRSKVYEPDLRPEDLLNGDIEAILIFLRNTAFGPEYIVNIPDPENPSRDIQTTIVLDELYFKETKVKPGEDGTFTTQLPKSGLMVKLKPLSFGEQNELEKMAESYPKGRVAPKQTWRLNKMVVEIEGSNDRGVIAQKIDTLPISDAKYIRKFIEENEPRLDLRKQVITPSGKETYVDIVFGVEFFRPFF